MTRTPTAAPLTEGRVFDSDWSIANVARLLRANASRGVWRSDPGNNAGTRSVNQYYLRTVSAGHLPTGASLIFMRLAPENCWYASLCFADAGGILPWNPESAELWLTALFGQDRPRILQAADSNGDSRQFTLPC